MPSRTRTGPGGASCAQFRLRHVTLAQGLPAKPAYFPPKDLISYNISSPNNFSRYNFLGQGDNCLRQPPGLRNSGGVARRKAQAFAFLGGHLVRPNGRGPPGRFPMRMGGWAPQTPPDLGPGLGLGPASRSVASTLGPPARAAHAVAGSSGRGGSCYALGTSGRGGPTTWLGPPVGAALRRGWDLRSGRSLGRRDQLGLTSGTTGPPGGPWFPGAFTP